MAREKTWGVVRDQHLWVHGLVALAAMPVLILFIRAAENSILGKSFGPLLAGIMLGGGWVSILWAVWAVATSTDGSSTWRMGATAEQWTSRELAKLGPLWAVENSVPFLKDDRPIDVDHVAIGPYGVLAVETKWTARTIDLSGALHRDVRWAMTQATANARRLRELLKPIAEIDVIPVVVYWGRDITPPHTPRRREGKVRIVAGTRAETWRPLLAQRRLDSELLERLAETVRTWRVEQERRALGEALDRHHRNARLWATGSMVAMITLAVLLFASQQWRAIDRALVRVFGLAGGGVGGVVFLTPLVLAIVGLGIIHVARRLDPGIPWFRGWTPFLLWIAAFGLLAIIA